MPTPPQKLHHSMSEDLLAGQDHREVAVGEVEEEALEGVGLVAAVEGERDWGG